jgi:hypothetical protein
MSDASLTTNSASFARNRAPARIVDGLRSRLSVVSPRPRVDCNLHRVLR